MNNGHAVVSVLITTLKPYFSFELAFLGVPMFDDIKSNLISRLELEFDQFHKNKNPSDIKIISNEIVDNECRRLLNKFFKAELGKKPQISICIHREDHFEKIEEH